MTSSPSKAPRGLAVVTGASSGIGAAAAVKLAENGFAVWAAARRLDRLHDVADAHEAITAVELDVTDPTSVQALADAVSSAIQEPEPSSGEPGTQSGAAGAPFGAAGLALLVNNAGGAIGLEPVMDADPADWLRMYETNVLGALRVTQALLPMLSSGSGGHVMLTGSIAGYGVYEGGAGYSAAKHAARAVMETLRLELNGLPVRVSEIAPGMVATEEFSLTRFRGDADRAAAVYRGVEHPLTAEDIAEIIAFVATRPAHVNIDLTIVKPVAQATSYKVARTS